MHGLTSVQKATRKQSKAHNKRLILKTIYDQAPISRADVARVTHLTRPTISSIVGELLEEGVVAEIGQGPSAGGKPPTWLSVVDDSRHLIGVDLLAAGAEFRGGVTNLRGQIICEQCVRLEERHGQAALERAYALLDGLIAAATSPLLGIGIGAPGLMDARQGVVRKAVSLEWQDLPLKDLLEARYNLPVYVANDSQLAALGEYTFGHNHRNSPNLIVIRIGRGTSAGIVLNGQLHYGDGSGAGEIGHVGIIEDGELCLCGHYGCLETVASSRAIIKQARIIAQNNANSLLHHFAATPEAINTDIVLQAFEAGDEELQEEVSKIGHYMGIAVANLVGAFNVKHILIGGSLARFGEPLLEPMRQVMKQRSLSMLAAETEIGLSSLGKDIVIQGATALLLSHELGLV